MTTRLRSSWAAAAPSTSTASQTATRLPWQTLRVGQCPVPLGSRSSQLDAASPGYDGCYDTSHDATSTTSHLATWPSAQAMPRARHRSQPDSRSPSTRDPASTSSQCTTRTASSHSRSTSKQAVDGAASQLPHLPSHSSTRRTLPSSTSQLGSTTRQQHPTLRPKLANHQPSSTRTRPPHLPLVRRTSNHRRPSRTQKQGWKQRHEQPCRCMRTMQQQAGGGCDSSDRPAMTPQWSRTHRRSWI